MNQLPNNLNIEVFNHHRFDSNAQGDFKCPKNDCDFNRPLREEEKNLHPDDKLLMWTHVQNVHEDLFTQLYEKYLTMAFIPQENKIDRAMEIVATSHLKINQVLSKLLLNKDNQQALHLIKEENKKMEQQLAQLLACPLGSNQQQTTSLGSL